MRSPLNDSLVTLSDIADITVDLEEQTETRSLNRKATILGYFERPLLKCRRIAEKPSLFSLMLKNLCPMELESSHERVQHLSKEHSKSF